MNPQINLTHLKFFCDAVVYESISEAAKMNFISQSAVSQAITKLETIFGVQLIYLNRQKIQVTDEGKIIFDQASSIFRAVQKTFDMIDETKDSISGSVQFITSKSLGMAYVAPIYLSLKETLPHINFRLNVGSRMRIRNALKQEDVDFAIVVYDKNNFGQFEKIPIQKGTFRLYQSKTLEAKLIHKEVLVCETDCLFVEDMKQHLEDQGIEQVNLTAVGGWDMAARFTELGIGIGFFPDYILRENRFPDITPHPIQLPSFEYEICAIHNKGVKLSRAAAAFIEHLQTR